MKCQMCNDREATIHLTEIVDNAKVEVHLCEECAKEQHISPIDPGSIPDLLLDINSPSESSDTTELICDRCGWSYEDFKREGKFGCPHDYEVFSEEIKPLLKRIHHSNKHVGKNPNARKTTDVNDLAKLRQQLEQAIAAERYEEAVIIRDQIRAL